MNKKKIIYDIGFNVDKTGVDEATGSLAKITNTLKQIHGMDIGSFMKSSGITDMKKAEEQLKLVKASAVAVGNALQSSFNSKLNTYNISKASKEIEKAGFAVKDLAILWKQAGAEGNIAFNQVANAMTQVQGVAARTTGVFNELGKTMSNTIRWKVTSSLVNNFTGSIQEAWGFTKALDSSLNNIRIVTGKSALEMEKFAKTANKAAKNLRTSTTAYTDASLIYYQQGLSDKDVKARTDVTIKAANVTGQSAAEVSEQLTAVWNGYKVVAEEAELYVDKLAAVAATTAADLEELSTGMSKVASAANAMGVDIDQLSAQMATIISVTRQDANAVGTALKTIYARMGDLQVDGVDEFGVTLGDVSGKLKQMGVDVLDQEGNLRDMGNVIEEVAGKWDTWTRAQQQAAAVAMAGKRQYNNLMALFENWDMYESSLSTSQNAEGTLEEQNKTYKESIRAMLQEVGTAKEGFMEELFNAETIEGFTSALTKLFEVLESITRAFGGLQNMLPVILGLVMKMSPAFSGTIAKGLHDFGTGFVSIFSHSKKIKKTTQEVEEYKKALESLGGEESAEGKEYSDLNSKADKARENRLTLTQKHDAGLINDEEYSAAKEKNEAYLRAIESNQQAILDRKKKDERDSVKTGISGGITLTEISAETSKSKEVAEQRGTTLADLTQEGLKGSNKAYTKYVTNVTNKMNSLKTSISGVSAELKKGKAGATAAALALEEIEDLDYLTAEQKKQLETLQKEIEQIERSTSEEDAAKITEKISAQVEAFAKDSAELYQSMIDDAEEAAREQDDLAQSSEKVAEGEEAVAEAMDEASSTDFASSLTDTIGSALALQGALGTTTSAIQGLKDGTVSAGAAITAMIPAVTSGISAVSSSIKMIQTAGQGLMGWISLAINAVQIGYSIFKLFKKKKGPSDLEIAKKELDAANETVKHVQDNLKAARERYAELKDEIADYRGMRTGLDQLRAGTEEWKDAINELNLQVLDLVDKYPQLKLLEEIKFGQTIYSIDEASIDAALAASRKEISVRESLGDFAKARATAAQINYENEAFEDKQGEYGNYSLRHSEESYDDGDLAAKEREATEKALNYIFFMSQGFYGNLNSAYGRAYYTDLNDKTGDLEFVLDLENLSKDLYSEEMYQEVEKGIQAQLDANNLTKEQAENIRQAITVVKEHNRTVDTNNKLLQAQLKEIKKDYAEDIGINSKVFSQLADNPENMVSGVPKISKKIGGDAGHDYSKGEERQDFIRNNERNFLTFFELDEEGNVVFTEDGEISTIIKGKTYGKPKDYGYIGGEIVEEDREEVQDWLNQFAHIAFGDSTLQVTGWEELFGKDPDEDEIDSVYVTVNGQEYTVDELRELAIQGAWRQQIGTTNAVLIDYQQQLQNEGRMEETAYFDKRFKSSNFVWDEGTLSKYQLILNSITAEEEDAHKTKTNATNAQIALKNEITTEIQNLNKKTKVNDLSTEDLSKFSLLTGSEVKSLMYEIGKAGSFTYQLTDEEGQPINVNGADALVSLINNENFSPEQVQQLQSLLVGANWTDSNWISNFQSQLYDLGVDLTGPWSKFFDTVNSGMKQWADDSKKVAERLAFLKNTIESIEIGEIISEEDYRELMLINPAAAKNFIKNAEGWSALASGKTIASEARSKYSDLGGLKDEYTSIRNNAAAAIKQGVVAGEGSDLSELSTLAGYFGYNLTFNDAGELIAYNVKNQNRLSSLQSLLGLSTGTIGGIFKSVVSDASLRTSAVKTLQNYAQKADQILIDYSTGYYDDESSVDIYTTSGVSYQEAKAAGVFGDKDPSVETDLSQREQSRLTYFKNQIRTELGVGVDWNSTLDIDGLQAIADAQYKRELDHYAEVDAALDKIDAKLENASGSAKWKLYAERTTAASQAQSLAEEKKGYADAVYQASIDAFKNRTEFDGIITDGKLNFGKAYEYLAANRDDETVVAEIQKLIDDALAAEEADLEVIEKQNDYLDAQIEAINALSDAVQKYNDFLSNEKEFWNIIVNGDDVKEVLGKASLSNRRDVLEEDIRLTVENFASYLNSIDPLKGISSEASVNEGTSGKTDEAVVEAYQNAQNQIAALKDFIVEAKDMWLEGLEDLISIYDKYIERITALNSILTNTANLLKLVGGTKYSTKNIQSLYDATIDYSKANYDASIAKMTQAKKVYEDIQKMGDNASEEMYQQAAATLESATEAVIAAATSWAEAIVTAFTEQMSAAIKEEFNVTEESMAWELVQAEDERFLDETNKAYAIDAFERKIQKSIDETDNVAIQQRLNKLRERELAILEQKGKLTQYDLDRANAEYELELKRIALEESQLTANKMQLVRDAMGNYGYQYVQDQDAIAQAQEELLAAENALYNLDKDRKKELINEWFSLMSEYESKMAEAMATGNKDLQNAIHEYYFGNNGMLTVLQNELGLLVGEDSEIGKLFSSTSLNITSTKISELGTTLADILENAQSSFSTVVTNVETVLTSSTGILAGSITALNTSVSDTEGIIKDFNSQAGTLVEDLSDLADEIVKYTNVFIQAAAKLETYSETATASASRDIMTANTTALLGATKSIYTLADKLDESFDATYKGMQIGQYYLDVTTDPTGESYYTIVANEPSDN